MFAMKWIHFGGLPTFEGDKTLERNDYFLTRKHSVLGAAATFRLRHAIGSKNYFDRWWFMINESLFSLQAEYFLQLIDSFGINIPCAFIHGN